MFGIPFSIRGTVNFNRPSMDVRSSMDFFRMMMMIHRSIMEYASMDGWTNSPMSNWIDRDAEHSLWNIGIGRWMDVSNEIEK